MVATRLKYMLCNRFKIFDNPFIFWSIINPKALRSLAAETLLEIEIFR